MPKKVGSQPKTTPTSAHCPLTMVDLAIFSIRNDALCVLLVRRPDSDGEPCPSAWALPGGFIDTARDENIEDAARRKLVEKTGVRSAYLEQLGSFGNRARDPRGWSVTTVYFALMPSGEISLHPGGNAGEAEWFPVEGYSALTGGLAFDHDAILTAALSRLRSKVEYTSLPVHLLGEEFTLAELQRMFEIVLGRKVDKSAFRTRMLSAGFIEETGNRKVGKNRPAQLFRLVRGNDQVFFPRTFYARKV